MDGPTFGRVVLAFVFVMGLMFAIAWTVRKLKIDQKLQGMGRAKGGLRLEESLYLDGKRRLVVIGHHASRYLLLLGPNGDTVLARLHDGDEKEDADD